MYFYNIKKFSDYCKHNYTMSKHAWKIIFFKKKTKLYIKLFKKTYQTSLIHEYLIKK